MNIFEELFALQQIDYLIRTRATGPPKSLASRLKTSECSIYRMLERLKDQGFPIAYDKSAQTYYYLSPVKWHAEFVVGNEKLLSIQGGEKKINYFFRLSNNDSTEPDLCKVIQTYGAQ